ncbi:SNU114 [[Candida] subhashii]|uniref:SNU114 n=1 Tax=[Candida] subhashii TaxID=561895 RepID=A0A8J5QK25_9ASCO|nr:SNU114 [[Candida] subhashii]KAG7661868.1 SNU114 [[Candida] subhashii]
MDSDDELYDEFGNLIGEPSDSEDEVSSLPDLQQVEEEDVSDEEVIEEETQQQALVKHTIDTDQSETVYIQSQATIAPSNEPVIKPRIEKRMKIDYNWDNLPELTYNREYLLQTSQELPDRIRNIAIVGNIHTGKSSIIDSLILDTHPSITQKSSKPLRFLDNHKLEIDREMTIKTSAISLLLQDLKQKSYVCNILDTPGHVDFQDESLVGLNSGDGAILVIDIVEGLTNRDKLLINEIIKHNVPIVLILNKLDRLILELRLPIKDCYLKLKYTVDDINEYIASNEYIATYTHDTILSPTLNNVIFASTKLDFAFSLKSFAQLYLNINQSKIHSSKFATMLWGDYYYDPNQHKFTSDSMNNSLSRTFISFILEPIYKIITHTITASPDDNKLAKLLWQNFRVSIHKSEYKKDAQVLLKAVFRAIFTNGISALIDSIANTIPAPTKTNKSLPNSDDVSMIAQVTKLIESSNGKKFTNLVRIHKGKITQGDKIRIYGENYLEDNDDFKNSEVVGNIYLPCGRYNVPVSEAHTGMIVIVDGPGIDSIIKKPGVTITLSQDPKLETVFDVPKYTTNSVFKIAVEPTNPSELPLLLDGLRKVNKSYLASVINVEESGEHVILAPGELYMDCILHDLRNFFNDDLQIKISDPMVRFAETCSETSFTKIPITVKENSISIIAEPVNDPSLSKAISTGRINIKSQPMKTISKILRTEFDWDSLASRSIWAFSNTDSSSSRNILLDDTLDTDKSPLLSIKDSIISGFKWTTTEGPLIDEPILNTKFKILDVVLQGDSISKSPATIIPMVRRAAYAGFITAQPRLLEPVYRLDVTCTYRCIKIVQELLKLRRGIYEKDAPIPGTQLFQVVGYLPIIESVGFSTDLTSYSQGQAVCSLVFHNWEIVPGDPLDDSVVLPSLKPVPTESLARDFMMKTRRRKGLTGEPSLSKYIDPELYLKLKERGLVN